MFIFIQASTPKWEGIYSIDNTCDPKRCCCFSSRLAITGRYPTTYTLTAGVSGLASYCGMSHTLTFRRPTGHTLSLESDGDQFDFRLSDDHETLYIDYKQEDKNTCSSVARRAATL